VSQPKVGEQVGERYDLVAEIGRGGMQQVYRALDTVLEREVALKVPLDARVARKFRSSSVLSAKVNHPNIAKTLDYFEDDEGRFYMVEELVIGENLREVARQFDRVDPHTAAHVMHHLARGVAASHRVGVVHRDLKPSNIMIAGGLAFNGVKITDFGIATMAQHEMLEAASGGEETTRKSKTMMNALAYVAPEVIESAATASMPADVWAVAAIAWELLTGTPPFGTGLKAIPALVSGKKPVLPERVRGHAQFGSLSREVGDIICSCLEYEPGKRPTAPALASRCDEICYLPPVREVGTVQNYPAASFGFIRSVDGARVFFHVRNVVSDGPRPPVGSRVWFTKFDGQPAPRAIPVVPLRAAEPAG